MRSRQPGHHDSHWCLVSPNCETKQMAPYFSATAAWKYCGPEEPKMADMRFEEFVEWNRKADFDVGLTAQAAYELWEGKEKLPDLLEFWGLRPPADAKPDFK